MVNKERILVKSSIPAKIVLGTCALGAGAIAFRALRLLTVGLACCGAKVYKTVSGNLAGKSSVKKFE
jgi:hypothetical protein